MSTPATRPSPARRRAADWPLLAEALAMLAAASLAIRLLPFRRVAAAASTAGRRAPGGDAEAVRRVRWAVRAWSRRVPWRTVCFQQGLALHWMLRRRGVPSVLLYGVGKRPEQGLAAHVWVEVDGEIVIGGDEAPDFACLARFPPEAV